MKKITCPYDIESGIVVIEKECKCPRCKQDREAESQQPYKLDMVEVRQPELLATLIESGKLYTSGLYDYLTVYLPKDIWGFYKGCFYEKEGKTRIFLELAKRGCYDCTDYINIIIK